MAAQDTYFQGIIDAINAQTADFRYILVGPNGTGPGMVMTLNAIVNVSATIQRPANTTAYAANQALAGAVTAVGGTPLLNMARTNGGSGIILDAVFSMSASTALQGELWLFDSPVTATADGSALSVTDADILKLVGVIPFLCTDTNSANAISYVTGLSIAYTCVGSYNLYGLVKVMGAVTPASGEVLGIRLKVQN